MADNVTVAVQFGAVEPLIEFPAEGVTVSVPLTPIGGHLYRLVGVPVFTESATFGDVIEAEPGEGGRSITSCRRTNSMASGHNPCSPN